MTESDNNNNTFNLELFFQLSPDLICIAGFDGYFKRINPIVSKTLGYTEEELLSKPISTFIYPDDKDITAKYRTSLLNNIPLLNFENRYLSKFGEIIWLSWTSMPIESEQIVFAIAKNVTYKKRLEEDRNAMLADLTQINSDLKRLTYATSHDLRSPVSNLLAIFNLFDDSKIQDEEAREFVSILKLATEDLKDTLNNYIDALSQKVSLKVDIEEVDINQSLNNVLQSLKALTQSAKAEINTNFSAFSTVKFNKTYLESVFLNLITNAIKYARPDASPVITICTQIEEGTKQIIFTDNGLGFDMEKVKDKVFKLNQHFHNQPDSKGVGLYLVYNHIVSLGGRITLESEVNKGAKFTISFRE